MFESFFQQELLHFASIQQLCRDLLEICMRLCNERGEKDRKGAKDLEEVQQQRRLLYSFVQLYKFFNVCSALPGEATPLRQLEAQNIQDSKNGWDARLNGVETY